MNTLPLNLKTAGLLIFAFAGVSCRALQKAGAERAALAVPDQWQQAQATMKRPAGDLTTWWKELGDPVLNALIAEALQNSPDVRSLLTRVEESRALRGVERSRLFPELSGSTSGSGSRRDNDLTGASNSESYEAGLNLNWEVDLFGRQRDTVRAASADLAQAAENWRGAQVTLAAEMASAYVTLRQAEAQIRVYESNLGAREETVQLTRWREQAGESSGLETQQALSSLEQARAALPTLRQTQQQTRHRLAVLAGLPPSSLNQRLAKSHPIPSPKNSLAVGIPAEALRARPDVRAAEQAVQAAIARHRSAEKERYPTFQLSGALSLQALTSGSLTSPETAVASVLGSLAAPIFNAGRISSRIEVQNQQEQRAWIAYESTILTALKEVEDALVSLQRTSEKMATLDRAVAAAREAESLAALSFKAGEKDLLTVLEAQRTLLNVEEQQAISRADRTRACILLYRALGGGSTVLEKASF